MSNVWDRYQYRINVYNFNNLYSSYMYVFPGKALRLILQLSVHVETCDNLL